MRQVTATDLELYAINTGEFYARHKELAGKPIEDWVEHVRGTVWRRYCREIEPVSCTLAVREAVAHKLKAYYDRHMVEMGLTRQEGDGEQHD